MISIFRTPGYTLTVTKSNKSLLNSPHGHGVMSSDLEFTIVQVVMRNLESEIFVPEPL